PGIRITVHGAAPGGQAAGLPDHRPERARRHRGGLRGAGGSADLGGCAMKDQAQMLREMAQAHRAAARGARVIAVTSGKGGVGKTNLAVNLGVALVQQGKRVALLDADLGLANVDLVLGDRKSTRLNSSHVKISYAVFCLKKKKKTRRQQGAETSAGW